jgi:hypothetical protein
MPGTRAARFASAVLVALVMMGGQGTAEEAPDERQLVLELIQGAGGADMAQQISSVMVSVMRQNYAAMVSNLIASQPSLSMEERLAVEQQLSNFDRFAERYNARLLAEVDFEGLLEQVYVPLYEKHFSESELRELLAFQQSAVGRKSTALMPQIMQEGMAGTLPILQPIIMSIATEILREEQAIALQKLR